MAYRKRRKRTPAPPAPAELDTEVEAEDVKDEVPIGQSDLPPEGPDAGDAEAVHKEAIDRYDVAWQKDRHNQNDGYDDLRFLAEEDAQWDAIALKQRRDEQRPVLSVNKCPQFVRQVTGDIRQLRPAVHVVPVDERGDDNVAVEVLPELVRYIERRSDAKAAYFSAADQMVAAGIGHCRIYTEYAAGTTMLQEIGIGLIQDGLGVVWDTDAIHPTRRDANYCFVPVDMDRKAAQQRWPDKSFDAPLQHEREALTTWATDDSVRVSEYWRKSQYQRELAVYPDGRVIDLTDDDADTEPGETADTGYGPDEGMRKISKAEADYRESDGQDRCGGCSMFRPPNGCTLVKGTIGPDMVCDHYDPALIPATESIPGLGGAAQRPPLGPGMGPKRADAIAAGATFEKRDSYRVERYIISAADILEGPELWPGMQIPIVPFLGEEVKIGRRVVRRGIVRVLKDVQRLYNYAVSADAEAVALQPKAPFKGTRKNFENFLDQWETANTKNWPFLEYEPDPLNGGRPPEREPPPVASSGIKELLGVASQDMSAVTGIYPSSLGAPAQETSGRAIVARQREGDTGTFLYIEAFGRAIERIGQIVVDLIPHIYDTERSLRVVGDDGKTTKIDINKTVTDPNGDGIDTITMNDLTVGSYQVSVEMGPSYSTKREEARDGMQTLMQSLGPQAAPLFADLFVQGQDFPLADKIAKRLRFLLPPKIADAEAAQSGEPPQPPPPPPPPPPELLLKAHEVDSKTALDAADLRLKQKDLDLKDREIALKEVQIEVEREKGRLNADVAMHGHAVKASGQRLDYANSEKQRVADHMTAMMSAGNGNGNGAAAAPPAQETVTEETDQQQQIDALVRAVSELQQAVVQIAQMAAPPPQGPQAGLPPGPPPGMPPMGPPPGAPPPGAPPGPPPAPAGVPPIG